MIRFHGGPVTPLRVAKDVWTAKHACVSWYRPEQVAEAFECAQSVMLDNGAFSAWRSGNPIPDWTPYVGFVREWYRHGSFAFAIIPDVIDGDEQANDTLLGWWATQGLPAWVGVPVWHLHESLERLDRLTRTYDRLAFGSSGEFEEIHTAAWRARMDDAMRVVCDDGGRPRTRLHGLRMMSPTVFSVYPFASVDSTNVARNHNRGPRAYPRISQTMEAMLIADRMERHACAARWVPVPTDDPTQFNMELVG